MPTKDAKLSEVKPILEARARAAAACRAKHKALLQAWPKVAGGLPGD